MKLTYISFGTIILQFFINVILAKPFEDEKQFSEENSNKLHCVDSSSNGIEEPKTAFNAYYENKPHSRFEGFDNLGNKLSNYEKRKLAYEANNEGLENYIQKRQVGVVYKDEMPIGILQPDKRSYRFVPVKDEQFETDYGQDEEEPSGKIEGGIYKREVSDVPHPYKRNQLYPIILTNFKIGDKLDKKRNDDSANGVDDSELNEILRDTRAVNSDNSLQFEKKLHNILDDMGLTENEGKDEEKRETAEDEENDSSEFKADRRKRDESCIEREIANAAKQTEIQSNQKLNSQTENSVASILNRQKRFKANPRHKFPNDEDTGDTNINGDTNSSDPYGDYNMKMNRRNINEKRDNDYENKIERQIEEKINNLKEEVKREIDKINQKSADKAKRSVSYDLNYEEDEAVDPALNVDGELKSLIRKRRETATVHQPGQISIHTIGKRSENKENPDGFADDDSQDLLGGDDMDSKNLLKREVPALNVYANEDFDDSYGVINRNYEKYQPLTQWRGRYRRKIDNDGAKRPQQLSDMSDLDLFGALPKSYEGVLSRYKRVKRK